MINYKIIINDLKKLADEHKQINSFGTGDLTQLIYLTQEIDGKENTENRQPVYPLMFCIPQPVQRSEQFITIPISVVIADIMNTKNYDIETDLVSDTLQIAEDILAQFKYSVTASQGDYESKYDITLPTTITPFSERYDDILVGWTLNLQLVINNPLNRCIAPFKDFE
jgi:hypothetical protein